MAGKRQATSNLNHDNWDQEDEPEERGTFRTAPPEELKARVIKKATRRKAAIGSADADDAGESPGRSVFSGFSGFGKPAAAAATGTPFAFLSNLPAAAATATFAESSPKPSTSISTTKDDAAITPPPAKRLTVEANIKNDLTSNSLSSSSPSTTRAVATTSIFGNTSANDPTTMFPKTPVSMFKSAVPAEKTTAGNAITASLEYRDNVAELNMAVMKFLQEHMDKNPYCLLSPVFDSYDKYAKELRQKDEAKSNATSSLTKTPSPSTKAETTTVAAPTTKTTAAAVTPKPPTITPAAAAFATTAPAAGFFFGKPTTTTATGTTLPSLSFGKKPNCTITSGGTTTTVTAPLFSFGNIQKPSTTPTKSEATSSTASPASIFSFGVKPATTAASNKTDSPKQGFFFGGQEAAAAAAAATATSPPKTNGFSFGLKSDDKPSTSVFTGFGKPPGETKLPAPSTGFSFTSGTTPFSFGNVKPPTASESAETNADNEDEDRPPVVEFNKVVEDDAIFSKRCKVFVKKDKDFVDRGVGTLYLKPVKDSEKTQMLVRADTNLGNILVNLILTDGLPCQRMGKNNVMMVCIPTPEEPKALSMLLRVKTGEEADELLEQIKKHTV
ncbi:nuclear pore complex protein Nup50 [Drosophila novamexicana]|uniref:nuclear pore complex protein Nup50 n=1 Tax=Drosophila novamexicana TaxID=47314 RepID=UPI0011E5B283|nr:nuclear pore complex protein Nup50 [Drosophila novamexicana]